MKKHLLKSTPLFAILLLLVYGCSFGGDSSSSEENADEMREQPDIAEVETGEDTEGTEGDPEDGEGEEASMIERDLYLLNGDGMVVPHSFQMPNEPEVLKQSLEYLVMDGPVTNQLPSGLQAVLPPETEILGVNLLEDGTAVVDFSPEVQEYPDEQEEALLQAVTWTLTQFENVENVEIQINGHIQENLPNANTPVGAGASRNNGINLESGGPADITASSAATLYFISQQGDDHYYVPVTRRIEESDNKAKAVINALLSGPAQQSNLLSGLRPGAEMLDEPELEDGVLTVNFNEALLSENDGTAIADETLMMLTLSLTEMDGIEEVAFHVNGEPQVERVSGESISEPVSLLDVKSK